MGTNVAADALMSVTYIGVNGGLVSLIYLVVMLGLKRYRLFMALPYGPFLVAGAFVLLFLGARVQALLGR